MSIPATPATFRRRIERVMGTAVVFDVRDEGVHPDTVAAATDAALADLRWVDRVFSTFRTDSEISRIGRGELAVDDADPAVRLVLARCATIAAATDGAFSIRPDDPGSPPLDPAGFVKGWAVDRAAGILVEHGLHRYAINAGGDVLVAGGRPDEPWRIGIRHPDDPGSIAAVLHVSDGASATSGTYERGSHIRSRSASAGTATDPGGALRSLTVVGPELGLADALATATFAAAGSTPWWSAFPGYEVLVIADDQVRWTSGLDGVVVAPAPVDDSGSDDAAVSGQVHRVL